MKTIKNVDSKPEHFQDDIDPEVLIKIPTFRQMFKAAIGMGLAKNGEDAIDAVQIGLKLKIDKPDIDLEDAEFKILKARCEANPGEWQRHFHGQVLLKLKEAEDSK